MTTQLALLSVLFCLSAFFSASETALFSLRRHDRLALDRKNTYAARCVLELLSAPHSLLVSVLFGNLLVNFLLMGVSAKVVSGLSAGVQGMVLGFLVTTVAVVFAGEVLPKAVAVTKPRGVALLAAPGLVLFRDTTRWLTSPLERLVSGSLDRVERRIPRAGGLTDQELKRFVELHGAEGVLERQASEFLAEAMELASRRASEVVTPRVDLVALELSPETSRETFFDLVKERRFNKVLVHDGGGLDQIHGYLRTRDVLRAPDDQPLLELVRPIWYVPSTKSLDSLLEEMVTRRVPLALAVDEFGGTHGLITLEDLVEEITGDIARDDAQPLLREGANSRWLLQGRFPLREAEELLGIQFAQGPTTLAGFVAGQLGRMPEAGDVVWHAGVQLRVARMDRRRVSEVEVSLPRPGRRVPRNEEVSENMTHSGAVRARERMQEWVAQSLPEEGQPPEEGLEVDPPRTPIKAAVPGAPAEDAPPERDPFASGSSLTQEGGEA